MGKTSASYYFSNILEKKYKILHIYISNEGVSELNTLTVQIIETILSVLINNVITKIHKNHILIMILFLTSTNLYLPLIQINRL